MPGEGSEPIETAPVVAVIIDQDEDSLLRELVGDQDTPMGGGHLGGGNGR